MTSHRGPCGARTRGLASPWAQPKAPSCCALDRDGCAPMVLNLPNTLTLFRIFLVPLLVVVLLTPPWAVAKAQETVGLEGFAEWLAAWREIVALVIFLVAAATDWLDGYLARSRNQITDLGKLLDPIADKLLTVSAFISLVELRLAPAWMVVLIIAHMPI